MKTRRTSEHTHRLVWVAQGSIVARDADRVYLVPRGHALWVPAGTRVSTCAATGSDVGSTALHVTKPPARLATVASFELTAPILRLASGIPGSGPAFDADRNTSTIVSRLETPAHHAMTIVLPSDPSLRDIAERILRDPCAPHTTKRHSVSVGVRATTLSSRFAHQTGLSLAQWRSRVRMYAAVVLLGQGISIGEVADSIGYRGPSDLSAAHRRVFGVTPMAFKRRGYRVRVDRATGSDPGLRGRSPAHPIDLLLPDPG